jgi:hypothetical protein
MSEIQSLIDDSYGFAKTKFFNKLKIYNIIYFIVDAFVR